MAEIQHNDRLNEFVISIGRSLLQYADECWPWVEASEAETQGLLHRLAALQRQEVAAMAELLDQRGWPVEFGGYPTDYTDLHFVSLDFLLSRIIAGEQATVSDLEEAVHACVDDPEAVHVLREVLMTERKIVERLQAVAASRTQIAGAV
jgi:hypothetical protein